MKIIFYDVKQYEKDSFDKILTKFPEINAEYIDSELTSHTIDLVRGCDAVCIFVNCQLDKELLDKLNNFNIKLILLRCAGFNNVDVEYANSLNMTILRVPAYSPQAIAEHAMALALAVNRHLHKAYIKVRENNFSLNGLAGITFSGKTAGIIGTGKIGACMSKICSGFGMNVIAHDIYPNKDLGFVKYVSLEELFQQSDLISLHCPSTLDNYHMINKLTINKMKDGVILINTSRGVLVDTDDLIAGIRSHKLGGVGLDVYEEESANVFENREDDILEHSTTARLLSFPNVIITSHQAFLTKEALEAIAETTLKNAVDFLNGNVSKTNLVASNI